MVCASQYSASLISSNLCTLDDGKTKGLCCNDVTTNPIPNFISDVVAPTPPRPGAPNAMVFDAVSPGEDEREYLMDIANDVLDGGSVNEEGTAEFFHQFFLQQDRTSKSKSIDDELGLKAAMVAKQLQKARGNNDN